MPVDPRDQLWNAAYETYYSCFFQEILSDALVTRWQRVDEATKLLVAFFASSSAIAGLISYFSKSLNIDWAWPVLTSIAAIAALFHKELAVPFRLRDHSENKRAFSALRLDIETFRYRMKIDPEFSIGEFTKNFEDLRKRYSEDYRRLRVDAFVTTRLRSQCQTVLDVRLEALHDRA